MYCLVVANSGVSKFFSMFPPEPPPRVWGASSCIMWVECQLSVLEIPGSTPRHGISSSFFLLNGFVKRNMNMNK